jgi:uncharacterized membrane protein YfcA
MSLRAFHLFFIAVSIVLAAFCAAWATSQYRVDQQPEYAIGAAVAVAGAIAMAVYGARFQRKTKHL